MIDKKLVFEFFNTVNHAVLSTVNKKGNPQGATVGFGQTKDLDLIFGTDKTTRKVKNISSNKHVSLVMNGPETTVQYEGLASLLTGKNLDEFQKIFFKKMPNMEKFASLPNQIYYKVTPKWIRYTNHATIPGKVIEIRF
jgi:general stress protein 26